MRVSVHAGQSCPYCHVAFAELSALAVKAHAFRRVGYDRRYIGVCLLAGQIEA